MRGPVSAAQQARGLDAERQAQLGDRAGRLRPARIVAGQGGQVILIGKARQGVVGLRLQVDRLDPALRLRAQLRHAAPVQQVGDQRR